MIVEKTKAPPIKGILVRDLKRLGVREGITMIVHSSLSSLGWVCGGAVAVFKP